MKAKILKYFIAIIFFTAAIYADIDHQSNNHDPIGQLLDSLLIDEVVALKGQKPITVKRIVIDPGHGGRDHGAVGRRGTKEKDIALAISKELKKQIKKRFNGIEVSLTRKKDRYLSLSKRSAIANSAKPDLFISIHANASHNKKAKGVETYYLNVSHKRYAQRLSNQNGDYHRTDNKDLQFIFTDLATKASVKDSIILGEYVQKSLVNNLRKKWHGVKDLGLKPALFHVLLGAKIPSILVEVSFLSHKIEEKRLKTSKYQKAIAKGIVSGIDKFITAAN